MLAKVRSEHHGNTITGILNSGTGNDSTGAKAQDANRQMVTWADVVRKPAVLRNVVERPRKDMNSKIVLKSSISQNNPVNRIKV